MRALVPLETCWDQVVVPRVLKQYGVDVVFNPQLTIRIRGRFGKVMILHNVEYHLIPKVYNWRMSTGWFLLEHMSTLAGELNTLGELGIEGPIDFLRRAREFTWERCARETLHVLEEVAAS